MEASIEQANLAKTNAKSLAGEGNAASPATLKKEELRKAIQHATNALVKTIKRINNAHARAGIVPAGGAGHAGPAAGSSGTGSALPAAGSGEGGTGTRSSSNTEAIIARVRAAGAVARARGEYPNNNNL
jgi:hypothetical protein